MSGIIMKHYIKVYKSCSCRWFTSDQKVAGSNPTICKVPLLDPCTILLKITLIAYAINCDNN